MIFSKWRNFCCRGKCVWHSPARTLESLKQQKPEFEMTTSGSVTRCGNLIFLPFYKSLFNILQNCEPSLVILFLFFCPNVYCCKERIIIEQFCCTCDLDDQMYRDAKGGHIVSEVVVKRLGQTTVVTQLTELSLPTPEDPGSNPVISNIYCAFIYCYLNSNMGRRN